MGVAVDQACHTPVAWGAGAPSGHMDREGAGHKDPSSALEEEGEVESNTGHLSATCTGPLETEGEKEGVVPWGDRSKGHGKGGGASRACGPCDAGVLGTPSRLGTGGAGSRNGPSRSGHGRDPCPGHGDGTSGGRRRSAWRTRWRRSGGGRCWSGCVWSGPCLCRPWGVPYPCGARQPS